MQITYDGFSFWELTADEFLQNLEEYDCRRGKVLARKSTAASVLLVAVDPEGEMQGFLRLEGFDRVTSYAQNGYLTSDGLAFLKAEAGNTARYFGIGQEPIEVYVGTYDRGRILAAAEEVVEEGYCDLNVEEMESCLDQLETRPGFVRPDVIGIFVTM